MRGCWKRTRASSPRAAARPFGLRGLTPASASNRGPPCERYLDVAQQPIAIAGSKGLPVFRTPKHSTNSFAHRSRDNLLGFEAALGLQPSHQRDDCGIISHGRHGRHVKRSAKNGVANLGDACRPIDGCSRLMLPRVQARIGDHLGTRARLAAIFYSERAARIFTIPPAPATNAVPAPAATPAAATTGSSTPSGTS
jgi:hypothetical protein